MSELDPPARRLRDLITHNIIRMLVDGLNGKEPIDAATVNAARQWFNDQFGKGTGDDEIESVEAILEQIRSKAEVPVVPELDLEGADPAIP
jgi:hypothetical protein